MTNQRLKEITSELNKTTSSEIVGVGYGFKEVNGRTTDQRTIVFTVIRKRPLSEIPESERIPNQLTFDGETFDTDVIEGSISPFGYDYCVPDFYLWQGQPPANRNTHRPLMGGISITNYTSLSSYVGTLGFIAVDNETNTLVGVSNNHVLCNDAFFTSERNQSGIRTNVFTPNGNKITQPNETGNFGISNSVGIVKKYQPISPIPFNNEVDCALVSFDQVGADGQVTVDPFVSWNQFGISGMTSSPRFATTQELDTLFQRPSQVYYSSGRTTGPKGQDNTKLFCVAHSTSISIDYGRQGTDTTCYMNDTFELQASGSTTPQGDWCYYPSSGGDSGSAILTMIETEWVIVGLLYGGRQIPNPENPQEMLPITTLCNRIDNIVSSLNIRAWDGTLNGINFARNNAPQIYIESGTSSDKYKIINGVKHWQMGMVNNSEFPPDPTPQPTSSPTSIPPTATPVPPNPTSTPNPTPQPTPSPTSIPPTATPSPTSIPPTATVATQTLTIGYNHLNSCSTSNLKLIVDGSQVSGDINMTQGTTGTGTVRTHTFNVGQVVEIQYKPFNLLSPCTNTNENPSVTMKLNGSQIGSTNTNTSTFQTLSYTIQQGVNPNFVAEMNSQLKPTPTPTPSHTLNLQNVSSSTYAHDCAKGYITVEKNGTEVARLIKTQGQTTASWNTSSISFTSSDNVVMKSYSQGGGGSGCATTDTTVRCVYDGSAKTSSSFNTGTNGQSFQIPDGNGTAFGWFFEVGGI